MLSAIQCYTHLTRLEKEIRRNRDPEQLPEIRRKYAKILYCVNLEGFQRNGLITEKLELVSGLIQRLSEPIQRDPNKYYPYT